jgi:hypothetical protein
MDPYLEGYLWPDVHQELATAIKALVAPHIAPKYVARVHVYTVEDATPRSELGITYPDVGLMQPRTWVREPAVAYGQPLVADLPSVVVPSTMLVTVRVPVVEIRDTEKNRLITAIEILSPVNKKQPGLDAYREKRAHLHRKGVHLLEIDLLRRGTRSLEHPMLPESHYAMLLTRAGSRETEAWVVNLPDRLPVLPVPLADPDPDALLDLRGALDMIYERSLYELSIDYQKDPPPPELNEAEREWLRSAIVAGAAMK